MVRSRFNEGTERMIATESWVSRTEAYEAFAEEPCARLCDVIARAGLGGERIGVETSYLSAAACRDIQRRLPKIEVVDCTALLDHVRFVKTRAEMTGCGRRRTSSTTCTWRSFRASVPATRNRRHIGGWSRAACVAA